MITPRRAVALYHLRMNPNNHKQGKWQLLDKNGCRCALGLIAEAFNIPVEADATASSKLNAEAYGKLRLVLDDNDQDRIINQTTMSNDIYERSFEQIADLLEKAWTEESTDMVLLAAEQRQQEKFREQDEQRLQGKFNEQKSW